MKQVLINYIVKPERVDENATLIKQVFAQMREEQVKGVKYAAYKMGENVFVHVAQFENEAAHQQFTSLESFKAFRKNMAERQIEKPVTNDIEEIGSFSTIHIKSSPVGE
jgi:quinol monooxygenase YgiN